MSSRRVQRLAGQDFTTRRNETSGQKTFAIMKNLGQNQLANPIGGFANADEYG
jgi:hypothetical protein